MDRAQKKQTVESLHEKFASAGSVVITHYKGLTVAEITQLRKNIANQGASISVVKNTLGRRAAEKTPYASLVSKMKGPTAIAFSDDPVTAAKVVVEFAKKNEKLLIIGGAIGNEVLDEDAVRTLAKLPSLDELRARIVGMISTPATRLAVLMQAPAAQLARVTNARSQQES